MEHQVILKTLVTIAANARMMIHDPWTMAIGNAAAIRKTADTLDVYTSSMVPAYAERSGKDEEEIETPGEEVEMEETEAKPMEQEEEQPPPPIQ